MRALPFVIVAASVFLGGCFSLGDKNTATSKQTLSPAPAEKPQLPKPKEIVSPSKTKKIELPEMLGGTVASDSWIVYKEEEKEEFKGNVFYDNGMYVFRAQYALAERKKQRITTQGSVYARKNEPNGVYYEIYANQVIYNYQTGKGTAQAAARKRIKLVYKTERGDLITALAQKAIFNTKQETFELIGNVLVTHLDPQGKQATLQADRLSGRQKDQYALLKGNALVKNAEYQLQADTLEYDGLKQLAYAYGDRPLARGANEDGTFAIIADKATIQTQSRHIELDGKVQGWVISDQLIKAGANKTL